MEQWSIWKKWAREFHRGKVTADSHPALPGSDQQYLDLQQRIENRLSIASSSRTRVRATFRVRHDQPETFRGMMLDLEVRWKETPR
jgi:hypothetical protein